MANSILFSGSIATALGFPLDFVELLTVCFFGSGSLDGFGATAGAEAGAAVAVAVAGADADAGAGGAPDGLSY
jgi:hypothetical protein